MMTFNETSFAISSSGMLNGGLNNEWSRAHDSDVTWVAFSNDGYLMATGGSDGCVKLWDSYSLQEIPIFRRKLKKKKSNKDDLS